MTKFPVHLTMILIREAFTEDLNLLWASKMACLSFVVIWAPIGERVTNIIAKNSMVAARFPISKAYALHKHNV